MSEVKTSSAKAAVPELSAYQAAYAAHIESLNDSASALRQRGMARFLEMGFPTRRDEAWKYVDLRAVTRTTFDVARHSSQTLAAVDVTGYALAQDAYRLVFIDGQFSPAQSSLSALPKGLTVTPLSEGNLPARTTQLVDETRTPFTAFNQAFMTDGVAIHLGQQCVLDKPIYMLFVSRQHEMPVMVHPRVVIEAEQHSQATILEHYVGDANAANLTNVVTEAWLADNAHVKHYKLQENGHQDIHVANMRVDQRRDAHFASYALTLGGALARNDLCAELDGENAQADFWGLFFGNGRQVLDNHTIVNHNVPRTFSNENYKGILGDRARGIFNGRVYIKRDAQEVRGYQSNANLLLSDRAEIDTKPELEIYADDVQCSHGATTGQLDADALFALRARGIDKEKARAMLTLAFAGEVLQATDLSVVAARVEHIVAGEMPDRFNLADLIDLAE